VGTRLVLDQADRELEAGLLAGIAVVGNSHVASCRRANSFRDFSRPENATFGQK
jgi:hypothetical protein